jgi:putative oxidoreductase
MNNDLTTRFTAMAPGILGATRIIIGALFACHGVQKVFGIWGMPPGVPAWITYGVGGVELIGGVLIMLGVFTRIAAFFCSGLMAGAYFYGHAAGGFWPIVNGGEAAILYCWIFLYFAAAGPGRFALLGAERRQI